MRNIKKYSIILSFLASTGVFAQKGAIFFAREYEKPEQLNMLSINIPIWNLGLSKINFSIYDVVGSIHYVGAGRVNGSVSYKLSLGDKLIPDTDDGNPRGDYIMSIYKPGHAQDFSANATIFVADQVKYKPHSFFLRQESSGGTKTNYFANIKTKILHRHGINVGYSMGYTWYNMSNDWYNKNMSLDIVSENGVSRTENLGSMTSVQHYKFIKLGYQFLKSVNSSVHFRGYGAKSSRELMVTGVNLIYAIENKFDDVYYGIYEPNADIMFFERYKIAETNKKLNFGIEFYQRFFEKRFPISYEYRVSYLPGMMKNLNIALHVGVNLQIDALRGNIKKYQRKIDEDTEPFEEGQSSTKKR